MKLVSISRSTANWCRKLNFLSIFFVCVANGMPKLIKLITSDGNNSFERSHMPFNRIRLNWALIEFNKNSRIHKLIINAELCLSIRLEIIDACAVQWLIFHLWVKTTILFRHKINESPGNSINNMMSRQLMIVSTFCLACNNKMLNMTMMRSCQE